MAINSIQAYSTTPSDNTDIAGINVDTGWPPSNVGPSVRALLAQLAAFSQPISVSLSSTSIALTAAQSSAPVLNFRGAAGAQAFVTLQPYPTSGFAQNFATDGHSVVLTTGSGTTVLIPPGTSAFFQCDGTNVSVCQTDVIGSGRDYWGSTAPAGYIFPYGQAVSRATYSALFAILGTTYGSGDGSTTFNLPDKRGRTSIAKDNLGGTAANRVTSAVSGVSGTTLGAAGGSQNAQRDTLTASSSSSASSGATSTVHDIGHVHSASTITGGGGPIGASGGFQEVATNTGSSGAGITVSTSVSTSVTTTTTVTSGLTGTSQNLPPGIVCNYIIYAGV